MKLHNSIVKVLTGLSVLFWYKDLPGMEADQYSLIRTDRFMAGTYIALLPVDVVVIVSKMLAYEATNELPYQEKNRLNHFGISLARDKILTHSPHDNTATILTCDHKPRAYLIGHAHSINSSSFNKEGNKVVTVSNDFAAKVWSCDGTLLVTLPEHKYIYTASFDPTGTKIITTAHDKTTKIWAIDGCLLATITDTFYASFSPLGDKVATSHCDNTAKLWSCDGDLLTILEGHYALVTSVAFDPVGMKIATASVDRTVRLWDNNGLKLASLIGHTDQVNSIMFNPLGTKIVSTSRDKTAKVWTCNGVLDGTLNGHMLSVKTAVFNEAGDKIITASDDFTAKIWHCNGDLIATLGHKGPVYAVIFGQINDTVITASHDDVKVWARFVLDLSLCEMILLNILLRNEGSHIFDQINQNCLRTMISFSDALRIVLQELRKRNC